MRRLGMILLSILLSACSLMTFHGTAQKQTVHTASRLERKTPACDVIGTITLEDGSEFRDSDIPSIAAKVAEVGGTHYIIRDSHRGRKLKATVVEVLVCLSGTD